MRLQGRVAVVTGAGSGIGRAAAMLCAAEGARVVVAEMNAETGQDTADQIRRGGGEAIAVMTDVASSDSVASLFARMDELALSPDVLVNNAGTSSGPVPVHETTNEDWEKQIHIHLYGTFFCTREALRRMLPRHQGVIINVASVAGLRGLPLGAAYSAAKGAILAFTKAVALEVAAEGVRVVCIAPGWVDTPLLASLSEELRSDIVRKIPMSRLATPDEIARVIAFLASDDASYLTGQVISPNGGIYT